MADSVEKVHKPLVIGVQRRGAASSPQSRPQLRRICAECKVSWPCLTVQELYRQKAERRPPWWYIDPNSPS